MDFGLVGSEVLAGDEAPSETSDPETKPKILPNGSAEDKSRISNKCLLRSNAVLSSDGHLEHMLSFSSVKSESSVLNRDGGLTGRTTQASVFPYYQQKSSAYVRNAAGCAGYGSGSLSSSMHGAFSWVRGSFTPSQWVELEHQALIYKYLSSSVPVPSNLLIPLKKCPYPYGLTASSAGSFPANTIGWGSFHLGFSGNTDPEPGRCRRTDGKKWRCSRDAVADQKYCERHINRGRHRSRKPVEGQTGHAASGTANPKVLPVTSSMSATVMPNMQHQLKSLLSSGSANPSIGASVNRIKDPRGINLIADESSATICRREIPLEESSALEFGLVSTDSHIPSHKSSYLNSSMTYDSFIDFSERETQDQHALLHFIEDWQKNQCSRSVMTWPEELKSDLTQLSMSMPITSDFSSSSSSPTQEKVAFSPLRLSREIEPTEMNLGVGIDPGEPNPKQINRVPLSWGSSMGGPLGEVLTTRTSSVNGFVTSSSLNLWSEGWDISPQMGASPTGV